MFGCKPCLPIDLIFGTNVADLKGNHISYIENLKRERPGHMKLLMTFSKGTGKKQMTLWLQNLMCKANDWQYSITTMYCL